MWRYRGTPHYLAEQGRRMGLRAIVVDSARNNKEIYKLSVVLAQLCERYHACRQSDGRMAFTFRELAQVKDALLQGEIESDKLFALAASSRAMLDEAWHAWDLEPPHRGVEVRCDNDEAIALVARKCPTGRLCDPVQILNPIA